MPLPQFFILGAPKAGTTALHGALATHPQLFLSPVKEPKFFLCDGRPPDPQHGPGDGHSSREWIWRRDRYESLFEVRALGGCAAKARRSTCTTTRRLGGSMHWSRTPGSSSWCATRSTGRTPTGCTCGRTGCEPEADFVEAVRAEPGRVARGWGPFWHYRGLGRYGEQLLRLFEYFDRTQVHVLRYRGLVGEPEATLDSVCRFLGVEPGPTRTASPENVRPYVPPSARRQLLSTVARAGAAAGSHAQPWVWRQVSRPVLHLLHAGGGARPTLTPQDRREVLGPMTDDVRLLGRLTGQSFDDWLGDDGRGDFRSRVGAAADEPG